MSGLPAKPSSCSTAISTGRPWQSHPARRGTCQPCMVLNRGKTSLNARASMWCVPGRPVNTTVTVGLAVGALVVLIAAVALRLADRLGLPSLLLYLALGLAIGEGGLGVDFENAALTQNLGVAALVVILAEGGLTTRWADARRAIGPGVALSTIGVVVSVVVVAAVGVWLL